MPGRKSEAGSEITQKHWPTIALLPKFASAVRIVCFLSSNLRIGSQIGLGAASPGLLFGARVYPGVFYCMLQTTLHRPLTNDGG